MRDTINFSFDSMPWIFYSVAVETKWCFVPTIRKSPFVRSWCWTEDIKQLISQFFFVYILFRFISFHIFLYLSLSLPHFNFLSMWVNSVPCCLRSIHDCDSLSITSNWQCSMATDSNWKTIWNLVYFMLTTRFMRFYCSTTIYDWK